MTRVLPWVISAGLTLAPAMASAQIPEGKYVGKHTFCEAENVNVSDFKTVESYVDNRVTCTDHREFPRRTYHFVHSTGQLREYQVLGEEIRTYLILDAASLSSITGRRDLCSDDVVSLSDLPMNYRGSKFTPATPYNYAVCADSEFGKLITRHFSDVFRDAVKRR